jgi:hypothetical protein
MKKYFFIFLSIIVFFVAGCTKENELNKSVFIDDPQNPDLPIYSEWGYNTFGAYYDREVFVSNDYIVPAKVIVTENTTSFILEGQKGPYSYYYGTNNKMSITFKLNGFLPEIYNSLVKLNDTILDLKDPVYQVSISIGDTTEYEADILNGQLEFKKAQNLFVDSEQVEVILSGLFEFQALINKKPVTISEGRFDVGIGSHNFYRY